MSVIFDPFHSEAQEQAKNEAPKFSELTATDKARLDQQRQVVFSVLKEKFGVSELKGDKVDLKLIQQILDKNVFSTKQTYELQSLGVVFGDILAKELGLRWVMVSDEYGTDPTLRYKNSMLNFNALTMISKRIERGEKVDVEVLFQMTEKHLNDLKDKVDQ